MKYLDYSQNLRYWYIWKWKWNEGTWYSIKPIYKWRYKMYKNYKLNRVQNECEIYK